MKKKSILHNKLLDILEKRNKIIDEDIIHYNNVNYLFHYEKAEGKYKGLSDDIQKLIYDYYTNLSNEKVIIKLRKIKLMNINSKNN